MLTQARQRLFLLTAVVLLGVVITIGSIYVQKTPALSFRWFSSLAERPLLAYQFAGLAEAAPQSDRKARAIPSLTYHRVVRDTSDVNNVTDDRFKEQMSTLKAAGWETVSLTEFEQFMRGEIELPEKSFLLTFDDGTRESFYPVDAVLAALDYEAANFIIVESSEIKKTIHYLNPREVRLMLSTGRWSIGSHSYDGHREYRVDPSGATGIYFADRIWNTSENRLETPEEFHARVQEDLAKAKVKLEELYGGPIVSFAFPLGNETGINGANNYTEGASVTEGIARGTYEFGFVQTNRQQFTANVPRTHVSSSQSTEPVSDPFLMYRIHVDYDWDGKRVLTELENSLPKDLPYEDDFTSNRGWIPSWGNLDIGRNNFVLSAGDENTSASAILDGSQIWDNYSFDIAMNWRSGNVLVLGDVTDSATYHACTYAPGEVRIQEVRSGAARTLATKADPRIQYGENIHAGIRVRGSVIECTWQFEALAEIYSRDFKGGVGIQAWAPEKGTAEIQVTSMIARPLDTSERSESGGGSTDEREPGAAN